MTQDFIPCTMSRPIGDGVFFRPIKSWHSGTFAGEGLLEIPGTNDRSGCLRQQAGDRICSQPLTVTHRLYWHERNESKTISAFLSYPGGMGFCSAGQYFWEAYNLGDNGDVERWTGDNAETEMETAIKAHFALGAS